MCRARPAVLLETRRRATSSTSTPDFSKSGKMLVQVDEGFGLEVVVRKSVQADERNVRMGKTQGYEVVAWDDCHVKVIGQTSGLESALDVRTMG